MYPYGQDDGLDQAVGKLSVRIHTALRDGGLNAETLVEPARLTEERDLPAPVTRELLGCPAAQAAVARLHRVPQDEPRVLHNG